MSKMKYLNLLDRLNITIIDAHNRWYRKDMDHIYQIERENFERYFNLKFYSSSEPTTKAKRLLSDWMRSNG